jgi:hypothetical protein
MNCFVAGRFIQVPQNTGQVDKGEQQHAVRRVDHGIPKRLLGFGCLFSTRAYGRRKLDDLVRQFGLRYPSVDDLTEYLADQVGNRHARSIGRPSKTAHPLLVERVDRESS